MKLVHFMNCFLNEIQVRRIGVYYVTETTTKRVLVRKLTVLDVFGDAFGASLDQFSAHSGQFRHADDETTDLHNLDVDSRLPWQQRGATRNLRADY